MEPDLTGGPGATVLWMRHGTSLDGHRQPTAHARPDTPLADLGRDQTRAAADLLRALRPMLVLSSPLPRARATAELLADALPAPLGPALDDLAEWRAPDCVAGLTPDQYPPAYQQWRAQRTDQPDLALPGGESLTAFTARATRARQIVDDIASGLAHDLARAVDGDAAPDAAPDGAGTVLVAVCHRVLIGAVAALHRGICDPGAVFTAATAFRLAPARWWTPAS